jgi:hypothetical protein
MSKNLGASTSWNPKGLSRPVMGLLYLLMLVHPSYTLADSPTLPRDLKPLYSWITKVIKNVFSSSEWIKNHYVNYKLYFQSCISMKILLFLISQNLNLTQLSGS